MRVSNKMITGMLSRDYPEIQWKVWKRTELVVVLLGRYHQSRKASFVASAHANQDEVFWIRWPFFAGGNAKEKAQKLVDKSHEALVV